jgi:hypothetical protein
MVATFAVLLILALVAVDAGMHRRKRRQEERRPGPPGAVELDAKRQDASTGP